MKPYSTSQSRVCIIIRKAYSISQSRVCISGSHTAQASQESAYQEAIQRKPVKSLHIRKPYSTSQSRGAGITQWVERPTQKPKRILTRVRVPGTARDFSPRVSFQCRVLTVATLTNPTYWRPFTIVWTHESNAHTDRNG